jgi:hypothetical protein
MTGGSGGRVSGLVRVGALAALTVQNAAQALIVKYSRTGRPPGTPPYLGSAVVLVTELLKVVLAIALLQARCLCAEWLGAVVGG